MIPAVFRAGITDPERLSVARKAAAGCIGIAGAVGAYGGFIPRGFAMAKEHRVARPGAVGLRGAYLVMAAVTYAVYARRGAGLAAERV